MSPSAIVIGSGPGGATAAEVLTRAGWSVVILEKGRNHLLDPDDLTRPAGDYSNDEIKFVSRFFLGPDPLVELGGSAIIAPDGRYLAGPVFEDEAVLTATLDLEEIEKESMTLDVSGHYSRPDIFELNVAIARKRP